MPDALSELTGGLFSAESLQIATGGTLSGLEPHQRTRIRDYVVESLRGIVLPGRKVEASRQLPVTDTELPKILVYTASEASEEWSRSPLELRRIVELVIDVCAGTRRFLDEYADSVANIIEQRLLQDPGLGGNAVDTMLVRTDLAMVEDHSIDLVLLRLVFQVTYTTQHVELVPDDLETIGVQLDIAPPDGQIDAEDLIDQPVKEGP